MIVLPTLKERAEFARTKLNLSKRAVALGVGLSDEGYRAIETGKSLSPRNKDKLIQVLQVDEDWLFLKNGGVVAYTKNGEGIPVPVNHVPVFTLDQISENMEAAKIKNKDDTVPVGKRCSLKSYAVVVKGDAMVSPFAGKLSFLEGEILVVDPERTPKNGDFVIIRKNDALEALFKKYISEGDEKYFISLNPEYKKIIFDETIKILGVVAGKYLYFE